MGIDTVDDERTEDMIEAIELALQLTKASPLEAMECCTEIIGKMLFADPCLGNRAKIAANMHQAIRLHAGLLATQAPIVDS